MCYNVPYRNLRIFCFTNSKMSIKLTLKRKTYSVIIYLHPPVLALLYVSYSTSNMYESHIPYKAWKNWLIACSYVRLCNPLFLRVSSTIYVAKFSSGMNCMSVHIHVYKWFHTRRVISYWVIFIWCAYYLTQIW